MKKLSTENLINSSWKKFALLKENATDGIRTHTQRSYWVSIPTPKPLGHLVCKTVEVRIIIPFWFLISVDSNSNRPVDAQFWSEIDYCWFFSYLDGLFGNWWKIFLTEKLISRLWTNFYIIWKNGLRLNSNPRTETIICISFLFSIDFISNPPVDALFWSQVDYCWFFSYLDSIFGNWWRNRRQKAW